MPRGDVTITEEAAARHGTAEGLAGAERTSVVAVSFAVTISCTTFCWSVPTVSLGSFMNQILKRTWAKKQAIPTTDCDQQELEAWGTYGLGQAHSKAGPRRLGNTLSQCD